MKRQYHVFHVSIGGWGTTRKGSWEDAVLSFALDPGDDEDVLKHYIEDDEEEEDEEQSCSAGPV